MKMNDVIDQSLSVMAIIALITLIVCAVPALSLWSINTLAELGGSDFYIEHGLFSYFVTLLTVAIVRGGS